MQFADVEKNGSTSEEQVCQQQSFSSMINVADLTSSSRSNVSTSPVKIETNVVDSRTNEDDISHPPRRSFQCSCSIFKSISSFFSFDGNNDAKGLALTKIPEAALWVASSVYFSTALIKVAYEDAGCITELQDGQTKLPDCDKRVYGIKPSSMLSLFVMILGICNAVIMPIFGAILDSSNRRRMVGALTAIGVTVITFAQSFVSRKNWFPVFILQLISFILLTSNSVVALAYLSELTKDKDKLARYNTVIMIFNSVSVVIFLIGMTVTTTLLKEDDPLVTARISLLSTFCLQFVIYGVSWTKLFGVRMSARKGAMDASLVNVESGGGSGDTARCQVVRNSFQSLKRTVAKIFTQRSEIKWFLLFRATSQPVIIAFTAATLSYITDQIQVSSRDVGITTLIVLVSAILGNKLSLTMMRRLNPLISLRMCMFLWIVLGPLLVFLVNKPGHETRLFLLSILWGVLMGWKEPADKTVLCNLVPRGIEAELSGLYVFAGHISMWVPPLLFTMMNENGIDIRIGLASFGGYFVISLFSLVVMGSYDSIVLATFAHEKEEFMTSLQSEEIKRSMSEHDLKLVSLGIGKPNGTTMRRSKSVTHVESVMSV